MDPVAESVLKWPVTVSVVPRVPEGLEPLRALAFNWWLTSKSIVMYSSSQIIGRRLAGAPIEDLLFGFSMILFTLAVWEFLGRRRETRISQDR